MPSKRTKITLYIWTTPSLTWDKAAMSKLQDYYVISYRNNCRVIQHLKPNKSDTETRSKTKCYMEKQWHTRTMKSLECLFSSSIALSMLSPRFALHTKTKTKLNLELKCLFQISRKEMKPSSYHKSHYNAFVFFQFF